MLTNLHIKNIGIIDDLDICFGNGFNVLTGETGAGKTLIIDALKIIAGGRFSKEMIRTNEEYSLVEACIFCPNSKLSEDGNIIVSREIFLNGRNTCKVNGRLVTVNELREVMKDIIDIHGQSDNQKLMEVTNHINYLDVFSSDRLDNLKQEYTVMYKEYCKIKKDLDDNFGDDIEKQRMLDLLNYQLNEINAANLIKGEEEELEEKKRLLSNSEKISNNLNESYLELNNNVLEGLNKSIKSMTKIENFSKSYSDKLIQIQSIYYDIEDIVEQVNQFVYEVEFDQELSCKVEERLDTIFALKRKYGNDISEILEYRERLIMQINEIENKEEYIIKQKEKIKVLSKRMREIAKNITNIRKENAILLEEKINSQFVDLEMKNAKFLVNIEEQEDFNKSGLDKVEFLVSTNIGEEFKPLTKIASGGEISRIMLAIKVVLSNIDITPIMIFDEIDTGISGTAAMAVSQKIKQISKFHQIICVTHLAVVAAKADNNFYIKKEVDINKTRTIVSLLNESETINEIARISSGEITKITLQHAKALRSLNIGA